MKWKMKTARRLWIWANSIQHKIIVECRSGPLKPYRPNSLQSRPAWWAIAGRWSPPVIYSWRRRMCLLLGVRLQTCDDQEQQKTQNTKRLLRSLYRQYHGLRVWPLGAISSKLFTWRPAWRAVADGVAPPVIYSCFFWLLEVKLKKSLEISFKKQNNVFCLVLLY